MKTRVTAPRPAFLGEEATAPGTSLQRAGLALAKVTLILIVGFMAVRSVSGWVHVAQIQQERMQGEREASAVEDFVTFYAAGQLVLKGRGDNLYDVAEIGKAEREAMGRPVGGINGNGILAYFNPPFVAAAFAPLSLLSVEMFSAALLGLVLASVAAGLLLMQRFLRLPTAQQTAGLWLLFLGLHATVWLVVQEQLSMFLLTGWLGFAWAQHRGKQRASGLALALVLVKPQMALLPLALLAWNRQWQALKAFGAVAGLLAAASVLISGPAVLVEYPRYLMHTTGWESQGVSTANMLGLNGLVARLIGDRSPPPLVLLPVVLPVLAVAATAWKGGWQPASPRFFLQVAVTLLAALLINPHLYLQDMVLLGLVIVFCVAYARSNANDFGLWLPIGVAVWFVLLWGPRMQVAHGIPVVAPTMIVLLVTALLKLRKSEPQAVEVEPARDAPLALAA